MSEHSMDGQSVDQQVEIPDTVAIPADAMINPSTLSAGQIMGSWAALLEPMALVAAIIVIGFWVFNREAPHIAEDL